MAVLSCVACGSFTEPRVSPPLELGQRSFLASMAAHTDAGRGEIGALLEAGVRIFGYKAALLHAKTMVVDGIWATVGSTNLDRRSFELNEELNLTVFDSRLASRLEDIFWSDLRLADEVTHEQWRMRGPKQRVFRAIRLPGQKSALGKSFNAWRNSRPRRPRN